MKQTEARKLFPKHKLVFSAGKLSVYDVNDTHRVDPVAEIELLVNGGSHLLVRNPKGKLSRFAVVRSYTGTNAVRKALEADKANGKNKAVSEIAVNRAFAKVQGEDFDCCIDILADHLKRGVQPDQWPFLTAHAKNTYQYTSDKKPTETKSEPAPKTAKKPARKITVGQAMFRAMTEGPATESAPTPNATKATKPESAPKPVKATKAPKAKVDRSKWSEEDELACQILMDAIANATRVLAHNHNARRQGISIEEYKARQKRTRGERK